MGAGRAAPIRISSSLSSSTALSYYHLRTRLSLVLAPVLAHVRDALSHHRSIAILQVALLATLKVRQPFPV
jgi:hypothetical protein